MCLEEGGLCESHILPEFLYESVYDHKHRFQIFSTAPDVPNFLRQKGLKEHLLCGKCEQRLSVWEGYACKFIRGELPLSLTGEGRLTCVEGVDYKNFKLFQLSVLWRAGVSKQRFFESVKLGPHAEKIRRLLANNDPGSPDRYACFMFGITDDAGKVVDLIAQPERKRLLGQVAYSFIFGSFRWVFLVSTEDTPTEFRPAAICEDGSMLILRTDADQMTDIAGFFNYLSSIGRYD